MNESAERVGSDQTKKPQNNKYNCNGIKHDDYPLIFLTQIPTGSVRVNRAIGQRLLDRPLATISGVFAKQYNSTRHTHCVRIGVCVLFVGVHNKIIRYLRQHKPWPGRYENKWQPRQARRVQGISSHLVIPIFLFFSMCAPANSSFLKTVGQSATPISLNKG